VVEGGAGDGVGVGVGVGAGVAVCLACAWGMCKERATVHDNNPKVI